MAQDQDSQLATDMAEWIEAELEGRLLILGPAAPVIHRWLLETGKKRYREFLDSKGPVFPAGLRTLHLDYQCSPEEISRIPRTGPVIVVANHPYRELEVPLLGAILADIRTDFRFLVTSTAMFNSLFREFFIPIQRFPNGRANTANRRSIRAAVQWLRTGGLVVVFPAGAIATRPAPAFKLTEQPWSEIAAVLARWSDAIVVPVFVHGCNHWTFYAASLLHPDLRYMAWIWDQLRRKRRLVRVSIGTPIRPQALIAQAGLKQTTEHLRLQTLALNV